MANSCMMTRVAWPDTLAELVSLSPDLFAVFDADDRLRAANPSYQAIYHADPAEQPRWQDIMKANFRNRRGPLIETDDIDAWLTNAVARRGTVAFRSFEAGLHGGAWLWITETVAPDGRMFFYASDISNLRSDDRLLRMERDSARRASWTDALTGVPNRRYLMDRLDHWLPAQKAQDDFGRHCLAILDLDHFKQVNDRYGHSVGDAVLVSFCRLAVDSTRTHDLFGRLGGEEFLLLMPNCMLDVGVRRLEDLLARVVQAGLAADHPAFRFTFSAGVAEVRADKDIHHAIKRADKRLYDAKAAGRSRILG